MTNNFLYTNNNARCEEAVDIEQELEKSTDEILENIDFSELEKILNEIDFTSNLFQNKTFKEYISSIITGEDVLKINDFFNVLLDSIKGSIKGLLSPLLLILVIVLVCNLFNNVRSKKITGVGDVVYFICFSVIVVIVSVLLSNVIENAKNALENIFKQTSAVFPILLTLISSMGGIVSVKAYTPMVAFWGNTISTVFIYILLPLFSLSLIITIVGCLSENTRLNKMNGFVDSLFKWIIGVVFAVFMAFLSIKGITAGSGDGISIKATKYAIKNYVPMLGGYISEGFEIVKAGSLLVKNAVGFAGIVLMVVVVISPILSVAILELGLKLLAGVIEPLGDRRSSELLFGVAKSLKLLVVVLVGVSLMYFLTIFLMMCSVSNFI